MGGIKSKFCNRFILYPDSVSLNIKRYREKKYF